MSLDPDRGLQARRQDATRDLNILLRLLVQATARSAAVSAAILASPARIHHIAAVAPSR
jgi:hypothetical protein